MSKEKMLNRQLLVFNIKRLCETLYKEVIVSDLVHIDSQRHRVEIVADGLNFYVDFHFRGNGSTSIDISSGLHMDKKKQVKDAILSDNTCLMSDEKN